MSDKKDFYIGWQDKMPASSQGFLKRFLIAVLLFILIMVFLVVKFQNPFNNFQFEFGNTKEFTGIYHQNPVPILELNADAVPEGFSTSVLLVGYGKFGAEGIMNKIQQEQEVIDGKQVTLRGTLIYGDGKTVMELTEKEHSLVKIHDGKRLPKAINSNPTSVQLKGEILDPKCYFGVMKPGEGKVHKSCATRCISGGIPPVFRAIDANKNYVYYIMRGPNGTKNEDSILPFIAEQIQISAKVDQINGWDVLYADPLSISLIE